MRVIPLFLLALSLNGFAEGLSKADAEALKLVQSILTNPEQLNQAAAGQPGGTEAVSSLSQLAGSKENEKEMLDLAASIFGTLVQETKGDGKKLAVLFEDLKAHPEKLEAKLTKGQKERLRVLATKIKPSGKL